MKTVDPCRQWADTFFGTILADVADLRDVAAVAGRLWDGLLAAFHDDELPADVHECACETFRRIGIRGSESWVHSEKSKRHSPIYVVNADGKRRRIPNQAIRATKKRRKDGTPYSQQQLWISFSYDETMAFFDSLFSVAYGATARVAAFAPVRDAYVAHPSARNLGEACRLAGIDPALIEITDADVRAILGA